VSLLSMLTGSAAAMASAIDGSLSVLRSIRRNRPSGLIELGRTVRQRRVVGDRCAAGFQSVAH
jgi:hypothetical protein